MMLTVKEDTLLVSFLRGIGKNIDSPNSRIEALIGTEGELAFVNNSFEIKDWSNLDNHTRGLIKKEVTPHDKIPDGTIGYIVTDKYYCGHMSAVCVFRDKVYNELRLYEYLMNPQEGDARWN